MITATIAGGLLGGTGGTTAFKVRVTVATPLTWIGPAGVIWMAVMKTEPATSQNHISKSPPRRLSPLGSINETFDLGA